MSKGGVDAFRYDSNPRGIMRTTSWEGRDLSLVLLFGTWECRDL